MKSTLIIWKKQPFYDNSYCGWTNNKFYITNELIPESNVQQNKYDSYESRLDCDEHKANVGQDGN